MFQALIQISGKVRGGFAAPALLGAALASLPASGGTIVDGASYAAYNAALDDPAYDAVGLLFGGGTATSATYLGASAGSGWVLAAAHVASTASSFSFNLNGSAYNSSAIFLDPRWTGDINDGGDLALIRLTQAVPGLPDAQLYGGSALELVNQTVTLTGYGSLGNGTSGASGPRGTYSVGQNLIDKQGGQVTFFNNYDKTLVFADFDNPASSNDNYSWSANQALTYEYMIAGGDSGGGVFATINGKETLVGVNSLLLSTDGSANSSYRDIGGFTTLEGALPWIAQTTGLVIVGDADLDGFVAQADLDAVLLNWGKTSQTWAKGDFDGDGRVQQADLDAVLLNWGSSTEPNLTAPAFTATALPEPASLLTLTAAAGLLIRRPGSR